MAAAKKAASKKAAKKTAAKPTPEAEQEETQPPPPPMDGEEYEAGYLGVSSDDEDYSVAAEVSRLNEE